MKRRPPGPRPDGRPGRRPFPSSSPPSTPHSPPVPRKPRPGPGGPAAPQSPTPPHHASPADGGAPPSAPNERGRWLPGGVRIVHEDEHVLVVDKPAGLVTASPIPTAERTLFDILKDHGRRSQGKRPGRKRDDRGRRPAADNRPVSVIHRLDRLASGLLVFARSAKAYEALKAELQSRKMRRIYTAVAEGVVGEPDATGTIQSHLREDHRGHVSSIDPAAFRGVASQPPRPQRRPDNRRPRTEPERGTEAARPAVTHFRVLGVRPGPPSGGPELGATLLQVRLETGRKHQIRVHFAERSHPLVGDRQYGASADPLGRIALHASELSFTHPETGETMRFTSPVPAAFYRLVGQKPPANAEPEPPAEETGSPAAETSWEEVAGWYDRMQEGDEGGPQADAAPNDHYQQVIIPGTLALLGETRGLRVLDAACGQGHISRRPAEAGASVTGVDAAPSLIEAAQRHSAEAGLGIDFRVGDARRLDGLGLEGFDAATCVMALTNIDPLEPVLRGIAGALRPGGRFVAVFSHPAFRSPGRTSWGWDERQSRQYRRVDAYLSTERTPIRMHPGKDPGVVTWTFHRPLGEYISALGAAGLLVDAVEEWTGKRLSTSGPRAPEENRVRREIPLFVAIRAVRKG